MAANAPITFRNGAKVDGEGGYGVEHRKLLTLRFTVVSKLIGRQTSRYLGETFDLSVAEWCVLAQLGEHSPSTLRQIAEITCTDKAQLSRASASLSKKGFVRRASDPKDARSVLFSLTPEGSALSDRVGRALGAFNQTLMNQLSEEENRALNSALETLTGFLRSSPDSNRSAETNNAHVSMGDHPLIT